MLFGLPLCISRDVRPDRVIAAMSNGNFVQFRNPRPYEIANFLAKLERKERADELECFIVCEYATDNETRAKFAALLDVAPAFLDRQE